MAHEEHSVKEIAAGIAVGGIIGAIAALFLAPKAGCDLRQDVQDVYEHIQDKTSDLADSISSPTSDFISSAMKLVGEVVGCTKALKYSAKTARPNQKDLLVGGVAAGVIGVGAAAYFLNRKCDSECASDWLGIAQSVVEGISGECKGKKCSTSKFNMDDVVHWVSVGAKVLQNIRR